MEYEVKLPSLKETSGDPEASDEATVSFFYKDEGEEIDQDESLVEMATDKATFDVPSPKKGVIKKILVAEDDVVEVGGALAVLEVEG